MKPRISWPESNSWKTLLQTLSLVNYNSIASIHSRICIVQSISANVTLIIAVIFDQFVAYLRMIGVTAKLLNINVQEEYYGTKFGPSMMHPVFRYKYNLFFI